MTIAIDGTAGSGKSTIAKLISSKYDIKYLSTGALYRAFALFCYENKIDVNNEKEIKNACSNCKIEVEYNNGIQHTFMNEKDCSEVLNNHEISSLASLVSQYKCVRNKLINTQRMIANKYDVVIEGRDIGSIVLPNADFKFYFSVTPEIRAERRLIDLRKSGNNTITYDELLKDIKERDLRDTTRKIAPLIKTPDAIVIDCSQTIENVMNQIAKVIERE